MPNRELQVLVRGRGDDRHGFQIVAFIVCPVCSALVWAGGFDQHTDWHRSVLRRLP